MRDPESKLIFIGAEVQKRRAQQIRARLVEAARSKTGPAAALASLMEGKDVDTILVEAVARFRCISWDVLRLKPELILEGQRLKHITSAELY